MYKKPDVEVLFEFNNTRKTPVEHGYRPAHAVKPDYLTTGVHHYYNTDVVQPGDSALGTITFITPEYYPHCLWVGKRMAMQEGSRVVGYATIRKIFNPILVAKDSNRELKGITTDYEFLAGNQKLIIQDAKLGSSWCTLFIEVNGNRVRLGTESLFRIKKKVLTGLRSADTVKLTNHKGVNLYQLIILGEPHAALGAAPQCDGGINLHLLDKDNDFSKIMTLSSEDVGRLLEWLDGLEFINSEPTRLHGFKLE